MENTIGIAPTKSSDAVWSPVRRTVNHLKWNQPKRPVREESTSMERGWTVGQVATWLAHKSEGFCFPFMWHCVIEFYSNKFGWHIFLFTFRGFTRYGFRIHMYLTLVFVVSIYLFPFVCWVLYVLVILPYTLLYLHHLPYKKNETKQQQWNMTDWTIELHWIIIRFH